MLLEVIATCMDDIVRAAAGGADRIELVTGLTEGGLTPSLGLIEEAASSSPVPVHVMIRPHSRTFVYDRDDLRVMVKDIRAVLRAGAAGIVLGVLTEEGRVNQEALKRLLAESGGLSVTFHRAFDDTRNLDEALDDLLSFPAIDRILTSGGQASALEAADTIRHLAGRLEHAPIRLLAGSGLTAESLPGFLLQTGVKEVHFGRGVRENGLASGRIDPERIRSIKRSAG
ncbi:copper homeostasis protein CutC [Cohnella sp. CFH 77786]|uniref:copper homeostasis protein CutC n=1 Tax=Cohnella sp. CFH 77786 TaxID=2662265 RepID=UPI001C60FBE8|nr:copper homeostasis protein CutC [Cohnella sp. CFH 77786]MBW5448523.1 copper homeostasis protein CutC [Cohnella sp. CFH 77786]